jgi:hypothetical protein
MLAGLTTVVASCFYTVVVRGDVVCGVSRPLLRSAAVVWPYGRLARVLLSMLRRLVRLPPPLSNVSWSGLFTLRVTDCVAACALITAVAHVARLAFGDTSVVRPGRWRHSRWFAAVARRRRRFCHLDESAASKLPAFRRAARWVLETRTRSPQSLASRLRLCAKRQRCSAV